MWIVCSRSSILQTSLAEKLRLRDEAWSILYPSLRNWDIFPLPDNILIDVDQLKNYPDEKTVIITTGSQGESMAALSRMASGMHRKVTIKPK